MNIGLEEHIELFRSRVEELRQGRGSVIAIKGEAGFGKTHLSKAFVEESGRRGVQIKAVMTETQAPIGKFNLGNIQPLLPFTRAIEKIIQDETASPEKKFMRNLGLTVLASIPVVDMVFYAVKEIGKDWREFKKDKSSEKMRKVSTATADYYDTFLSMTDKAPLIVIIDDMHWSDSQSVELLSLMEENISTTPLMIVFTYKESILHSKATPLAHYFSRKSARPESFFEIHLKEFDSKMIRIACREMIDNYQPNNEFEDKLLDKSLGIPGTIIEYLKYYKSLSPFNDDGSLRDISNETDYMPTGNQALFTHALESLTEDERNTLAVCSAEGREFTAHIASKLLSTDILTTIKRLRHLQSKTGIIKSAGAHSRYGVKTTIYQFTQGFYHSFFEKSLEYEEHISLHGQIAAILKAEYESSDDPGIKEQIAPYLAAHSAESGDETTARSMILYAAEAAVKYGSNEVIQEAYNNFVEHGNLKGKTDENEDGSPIDSESLTFNELVRSVSGSDENGNGENSISASTEAPILQVTEFSTIRKAILKDINAGNLESAEKLAETYQNIHGTDMTVAEQVQLTCLLSRIQLGYGNISEADSLADKAVRTDCGDKITECLALNTISLVRLYQKRLDDSLKYLQQAAKLSMRLPAEMRLLTLSNIGFVTQEFSPSESVKYLNAAKKLSQALSLDNVI